MHNFLSILFKTFQLIILQYHFGRFSCLNTFFGTFLGKGTFFNNLSERAKRVFLDSKVKFVCIMYQRNDWDKKISRKQFFHFFHDIILTQCPTCLYCVTLGLGCEVLDFPPSIHILYFQWFNKLTIPRRVNRIVRRM